MQCAWQWIEMDDDSAPRHRRYLALRAAGFDGPTPSETFSARVAHGRMALSVRRRSPRLT